jgi:hypothetical protein
MPPRQFANSVFEPGHGLAGNASPERRSSSIVKPRNDRCHGWATARFSVLICIEAQFDEAGQARGEPPARPFRCGRRCCSHPQFGGRDGQARYISFNTRLESKGESGCLVRSFPGFQRTARHRAHRRSGIPDQPENPPVRDPRRNRCHQPVVIDPVKEIPILLCRRDQEFKSGYSVTILTPLCKVPGASAG